MAATSVALTGRGPTGRRTEWEVVIGERVTSPDPLLRTDRATLAEDGRTVLRRTLAMTDGDRLEPAERLLDNEIRALTRLANRYPAQHYPAGLPRLIGYDFDSAEPFALIDDYRGEAATTSVLHLVTEQRTALAAGLLRALADLAAVDLVHGAIGLASIRWDGEAAQLVDLGHAVAVGELRRTRVDSPWVAPDQPSSPACPGDDVWAAGLVIHQVFTARDKLDAGPPNLTDEQPFLRDLLAGVFAPSAADRPSAADLLRRLAIPVPRPLALDADAAFQPGRAQFDLARRDKLRAAGPGESATPAGGPPAPFPRAVDSRVYRLVGVLGLLVVVVGVLLLVFGVI